LNIFKNLINIFDKNSKLNKNNYLKIFLILAFNILFIPPNFRFSKEITYLDKVRFIEIRLKYQKIEVPAQNSTKINLRNFEIPNFLYFF
jgi:hypothetical protein